MSNINLKDTLRLAVEAASGGKQTVRYTKGGQPCFFTVIEQVSLNELNPRFSAALADMNSVHPAFKNGKTISNKILVGTYASALINGELVSQPNTVADTTHSINAASAKIINQGQNWHLMTVLEVSLLRSLSFKAQHHVQGNTSKLGWSMMDKTQDGRRVDGKAKNQIAAENGFNDPNQASQIFAGSGPISFRHDSSHTGVSDLVGGFHWTYCQGTRLIGGELQFYVGDGVSGMADLQATELFVESSGENSKWKAMDATTGEFKNPTYAGSLVNANYKPTTVNSIRLVNVGSSAPNSLNIGGVFVEATGVASDFSQLSEKVVAKLNMYLAYPDTYERDFSKTPAEFYFPDITYTRSKAATIQFGRENLYQTFHATNKDEVATEYFNQRNSRIVIHE